MGFWVRSAGGEGWMRWGRWRLGNWRWLIVWGRGMGMEVSSSFFIFFFLVFVFFPPRDLHLQSCLVLFFSRLSLTMGPLVCPRRGDFLCVFLFFLHIRHCPVRCFSHRLIIDKATCFFSLVSTLLLVIALSPRSTGSTAGDAEKNERGSI